MTLLKTKREALLEPLQAVAGIIERRHTLPILSNVLLSRSDSRLDFVATDIEIEITTSMPAEDFPRLAIAEGAGTGFTVPQKLLRSLLGLVQYAMAQQDIRYYLNGLLMVVEDEQLKLVATDGHRLAYASHRIGGKGLSRQEVILPRKTIIELSKLLDESDDPVAIDLSASQARFKFGN